MNKYLVSFQAKQTVLVEADSEEYAKAIAWSHLGGDYLKYPEIVGVEEVSEE